MLTAPLSEKQTRWIIWVLMGLIPLVGMAVDLIAPSLPAIASGLQVSSKLAKDVISIYLFGYALGNFLAGFLADAWGRQKLLHFSLLGFICVSLIPIFFARIDALLLARFLQGLALGSIAVLARAICSDILPAEKLIRMGTLLGTMWGLGPVVGPIIGGYLQVYFGWKAGFWFFSGFGVVGLILSLFIIPETHTNRHPLDFRIIKQNILELFMHRVFVSIIILMGFMYSLLIVFNTAGPFLIEKVFDYSPVFFGHLAFWLGIVFLISTFACRHFLKKYSVEQLYFVAINGFFGLSLLGVILSYFFAQSILLVAIVSAAMFFACGFIFPLSAGKGLSLFRHIAGTASATMYFVNTSITSFMSFLIGFLNVHSAIPMMWAYFALLSAGMMMYWWRFR